MSYSDVIGRTAGVEPSADVDAFLAGFLLPDEPVLAALHGTVRRQPAWVVVTPGVVAVVREGPPVTLEGAAPAGERIGWAAEDRWGHHALHVDLGGDRITVEHVGARRSHGLLAAVDVATASLDGGHPPRVAGVLRDVDVVKPVGVARHARADGLPRVRGPDLFAAVAGGLTHLDELTYSVGLVLVACAGARDGPAHRPGRRETVVAAVTEDHRTAPEDYDAVRSLRRAQSDGTDVAVWRDVVGGLATAVAATAALLAPDALQARATMFETAADLRGIAAAEARPEPTGGVPPDLLDTLERLQHLHESGALADGEYQELKRRALDTWGG